jgi:ubiquinone/menaquinone biosynthesis C-methylase UbiE
LTNPEKFTSGPYNRRRLVVQHMDALDLRYEDGTFDIVFSLSSIEHFGSLGAAQKAVQEMERVCRTGGIVGIATEVVVDNGPHFSLPGLELFSPATLKELFASAPNLTVTDDVSFDISRATLDTCLSLDAVLEDRNKGVQRFPHIVLEKKGRLFTSILVFLRKT